MLQYNKHDFFSTVLFVALIVLISFIVKAGNGNARFWGLTAVLQADPSCVGCEGVSVGEEFLMFCRNVVHLALGSGSRRWVDSS
jgi:hypothetical protein